MVAADEPERRRLARLGVGVVGVDLREGPGVDRVAASDYSEQGRHRADGSSVVARDHLDLHVLLGEELQGASGVGPDPLLEDDERRRGHGAGCRGVGDRQRPLGQQQHPQPARADLLGGLASR